ncbi:MAG: YtxH domain-containing protein [Chloroflexi bacterium]|nr:YtxH domain-containing protein [Chloroflexota bacterium]
MRFIVGLLLGVMLGATFGLLLAPQPGSETRKALRDRIRRRGEAVEEEI